MPVLSQDDLNFWKENGYLLVRSAVPLAYCQAAEQATWEFMGRKSDDPNIWYPELEGKASRTILSSMYHNQAEWNIRQHPRVHEVFAELHGTTKLWVSIDQTGFNPPVRDDWSYHERYKLHWDMALEPPFHHYLQGLVYLTDTTADQGAFRCVPGFHRQLERWLETLPAEERPQRFSPPDLVPQPVPGNAGDLIIWNSGLPHGSSPNHAQRPRIVCFLTMFPAQDDEESRNRRISWIENRYAWPLIEVQKDRTFEYNREIEHDQGTPPVLTPLGRRLGACPRNQSGLGMGVEEALYSNSIAGVVSRVV